MKRPPRAAFFVSESVVVRHGDFESLTIPGEGAIAVTAYKWRAPAEWLFPGGNKIVAQTDGLLRAQLTTLLDAGGNPQANRGYTYNAENHITAIATESGTHNYTLDQLYRLIAAAFEASTQLQDESYTYDGVGNRLTENGSDLWAYNGNHELESRPDATYTYDANGHTTSKTEGGVTTIYEYDLAERMSTVRIDGGATLGQYEYDPFGRRTKKVTVSGTRYFHYDDTGLLAEYDASGNLISEYQYKPGSTWMTNPLFKRDTTNKVHYYYNSHLGQPLKLFDRSGKITWEGRSQAFGETTILIEETENNLRFPGQYEDQETGLYYNYQRYYDPNVGRYVTPDALGPRVTPSFYAYADLQPLFYIDPLGLFSTCEAKYQKCRRFDCRRAGVAMNTCHIRCEEARMSCREDPTEEDEEESDDLATDGECDLLPSLVPLRG